MIALGSVSALSTGSRAAQGSRTVTEASHPLHAGRPAQRRFTKASGLDAFTLGTLGIAAHLAVISVAIGLMTLYDTLAAGFGQPVLAGALIGLAAVLVIAATAALGVVVLRRQHSLAAWVDRWLGQWPRLRRVAIWAGFAAAVGGRALLLALAAAAPAAAFLMTPWPDSARTLSPATAYGLLAVCYLILAPLLTVRLQRGLRRLRARRNWALRSVRG
jgi:hypothetical protein